VRLGSEVSVVMTGNVTAHPTNVHDEPGNETASFGG
jgi:hypothetical protein